MKKILNKLNDLGCAVHHDSYGQFLCIHSKDSFLNSVHGLYIPKRKSIFYYDQIKGNEVHVPIDTEQQIDEFLEFLKHKYD